MDMINVVLGLTFQVIYLFDLKHQFLLLHALLQHSMLNLKLYKDKLRPPPPCTVSTRFCGITIYIV